MPITAVFCLGKHSVSLSLINMVVMACYVVFFCTVLPVQGIDYRILDTVDETNQRCIFTIAGVKCSLADVSNRGIALLLQPCTPATVCLQSLRLVSDVLMDTVSKPVVSLGFMQEF